MPRTFKYLTRLGQGGGERAADEAVEASYRRADLVRRPVVRDELNGRYIVFESRREMFDYYGGLPSSEKAWHEVVFGYLPQRLKFDIDAPSHKIDAIQDSAIAAAALRRPNQEPEEPPQDQLPIEDLTEILGGTEYVVGPPPTDPSTDADDLLTEILSAGPPVSPVSPDEQARAAQQRKMNAIINIIIEAILDELYVAYFGVEDIFPTRTDLVVTESSGLASGSWKFSYHIIIWPYAVADNAEAQEFTARVIDRLPQFIRPLVDGAVNKRIQNFRMLGSAKAGTARFKRVIPETAAAFRTFASPEPEHVLITATGGVKILPRVYTDEAADRSGKTPRQPAFGPEDPVVRAALDAAANAGVTAGHTFTEVRGVLLCFKREAPSYCRICGEEHHRDNSLMVSISPEIGGHDGPWPGTGIVTCRVVEHCRQARGKAREIGTVSLRAEDLRAGGRDLSAAVDRRRKAAPARAPLGLREQIAARVGAIREGRLNPHSALASEFERLPESQKTVYSEPAMRDYELTPTLAVLAQMKLGKTKALRRFIETYFPGDGLETRVVRFVTFRQTFSRSLAETFPDFTVYSDVNGDLCPARHPRLIVQVESLHRLKMGSRPEPVDLLVLDEVESILAQFNSGLHRHFAAAFAMFSWMLRTARHVVCMDANLSDRTYRTLARMRPAHPPHFHWNRFARAADDVYSFTADQGAWLEKLHSAVRAGQRIVLPTNSLSEAKAFEAALRREFPTRKIMLYSSETAPSEKARHFADVHTYWGELDVLIYTPTCSAGVSFELKHFDALFGFFCDASCDVETCRQMLGRVRNLGTREHTICLRSTGAALPTTVEDIRRLVYDKRAGLYRKVEDAALYFSYSDDGSIDHYGSDYFHLWLESVRMINLSRNEFAARFIDQVADTGARIESLAVEPTEARVGAALMVSHKETRAELKDARCAAIADAMEITPDEATLVREALQAQQDVDPASRLAYEKYMLREAYAWHGRPLDASFVAAYQGAEPRRVYRNLIRITEGATVSDSLELMRQREASHYAYVMETRSPLSGYINEGRDLVRDRSVYVYTAHFFAVWLLNLCGFRCITDRRRVHETAMETTLRKAIPNLKKAIDKIVFEFEIPRPNLDRLARETDQARFLANALRTINAVLRMMYGIQVSRCPKRTGGGAYLITQNPTGKLFVFSHTPEDDKIPGGPRPHIPSNLKEAGGAADDRVNIFLDRTFYDRARDGTWGDDPAPDGGPMFGEPEDPPGEPEDPPGEPEDPPGEPEDPLDEILGLAEPRAPLSPVDTDTKDGSNIDEFLQNEYEELMGMRESAGLRAGW